MNQFYLFKCIGIYCNLCRESMILKLGYGRASTNPTYTKNISKGHIDTCMLVDHNPGNWQCWPYIQLIQSLIPEALLTCISTHIPLIHLFITTRSHTLLACWPHSVQSRVYTGDNCMESLSMSSLSERLVLYCTVFFVSINTYI